jgi:fructokinase
MATLFTAIGEILIDFTPINERGATVGFRMHPGGSPLNVAVGLARLGARVEFAGKVSTDFFGRFLAAHLKHEGVGTRFLSHSDAPSTLAFVTLEDGDPAFSFHREGAADTLLLPRDLPEEIAQTQFLHFGSISLMNEPTAGTITGLVEQLRSRAILSFDPNIRPGLISDRRRYRELLARLFQSADIVKISATDLRWFDPDHSPEGAAGALMEMGPALVAVTQGPRGAYARWHAGEVRVPARAVEVVDTVGAGDAFTSGLLFALVERGVTSRAGLQEMRTDVLEAGLRFATASAAVTCTRAGADPPRRDEVEAVLS